MTAKQTMSEAVKKAIIGSGLSQSELAKKTGVSRAALCLFLSGKRGLTLDSAEKLGRVLGLEIRTVKPTGRKRRH